MSETIELGCRCGAVHGWSHGAEPKSVNRVICYCDDCQAFLHYLDRADLLDAHGGTEIVQTAPCSVQFDAGVDKIAGVRLSTKGMHRWFASCCKTPLGNTLTPSIPFIGMALEVFRGAPEQARRDAVFGRVRGVMFTKFAVGSVPATPKEMGPVQLIRVGALLLGWKLSGKAWPHPFFDRATGRPSCPITTLSTTERDALRSKCGPRAPNPASGG